MTLRGKSKAIVPRKTKVKPIEKKIDIGLGEISTKNENRLMTSINRFYNLSEDPTTYNYIYNAFSRNITHHTRFNNRYQLIRIYKKNTKVFEHGHIYYSLVKRGSDYCKRKVFLKELPLIEPNDFINHITEFKNTSPISASYFGQKLFHNLYNFNNPSYIDILCHYLNSRLVEEGVSPHFPLFYGTINTVFKKYSYTFSDDDEYQGFLESQEIEPGYQGEHFRIINKEDKDKIEIRDFPVSLMATETLDFDFGDYLEKMEDLYNEHPDDFDSEKFSSAIKSVFFQVAFALSHCQKRWNMIHNDLHLGNVMFKHTDEEYMYYCVGGRFFKVPTHNMLVKIIDWNRATLSLNGHNFNNMAYDQDKECSDMYYFPTVGCKKRQINEPNPSFDLCLLTFEMLNNYKAFKKTCNKGRLYTYLMDLLKTDSGDSIFQMYRKTDKDEDRCGFGLYIDIANGCSRAVPSQQFSKTIWNSFKIEKSQIPKDKKIYHLDL